MNTPRSGSSLKESADRLTPAEARTLLERAYLTPELEAKLRVIAGIERTPMPPFPRLVHSRKG